MKLELHVHWLPKAGNTEVEYEDAFACSCKVSDNAGGKGCSQEHQVQLSEGHFQHSEVQLRSEDTFQVAIADGATESTWAKSWAQHLVKAYVHEPFSSLSEVYQRNIHQTWFQEQLDQIRKNPPPIPPWILEEGLRRGAYATLLGVEFSYQDGSWYCQAFAVGDCCLFHIRGDRLIKAFPLDSPDAFNSTPVLISTRPSGCADQGCADQSAPSNSEASSSSCLTDVKCQEGDEFWLMSDALACWFLRTQENEPGIVRQMQKISNCDEFRKKIEDEREQKRLRNDDVTWMIIRIKAVDSLQEAEESTVTRSTSSEACTSSDESENSTSAAKKSTPSVQLSILDRLRRGFQRVASWAASVTARLGSITARTGESIRRKWEGVRRWWGGRGGNTKPE